MTILACRFAGNGRNYCYISNTSPFPAAVTEVGTDLSPALFKFSKRTLFNRAGHSRRGPCKRSGLPDKTQW